MTELRFIYDCERMDKVLQYREVIDGVAVTQWKEVPTVYTTYTADDFSVELNTEA